MKTYEEMAHSALERIGKQEAQNSRCRKTAAFAVPALSLCIAAMIGFGAWRSGIFKNEPMPAIMAGETTSSGDTVTRPANAASAEDKVQPAGKTTEIPCDPESRDTININRADKMPVESIANIALFWNDFVSMSKEEILDYFGTEIFPDVPADLTFMDESQDSTKRLGIYRRNSGTGEIYYDTMNICYSNADGSRYVTVLSDKDSIPFNLFAVDSTDYEKSVINGQEMIIGFDIITEKYFIGFEHNGVGFAVISGGLEESEIIGILRSLVG